MKFGHRIKLSFDNQNGIIGVLVGILLLVIISGGGWFYVTRGNIFLNKSPDVESPEKSDQNNPAPKPYRITLEPSKDLSNDKLHSGEIFKVKVLLNAENAINLVSTKVSYPSKNVKVRSVNGEGGVVKLWLDKGDDPNSQEIVLMGGIPNPGYKSLSGEKGLLAEIEFDVVDVNLSGGEAIKLDSSEVFLNSDNSVIRDIETNTVQLSQKVLGTTTGGKITLSPSAVSVNKGCTFDVTVYADANGAEIVGFDVIMVYDTKQISVASSVAGSISSAPDFPFNLLTADNKASFSILPITAYTGSGTLAKITFKVSDKATSTFLPIDIKFDPNNPQNTTDTNMVTKGIKDNISSVSGTSVNIGSGTSCSTTTTTNVASSSAKIASSSASVKATKSEGDVSEDGYLDLSDVSTLLTDFNKKDSINGDLNGDGKVNVADFSLLVKFLKDKGII